jgi:methylmalonyl-CoA/ethylmalonyl-CoA epimerase
MGFRHGRRPDQLVTYRSRIKDKKWNKEVSVMPEIEKVPVKKVLQIGIVVKDLQKAMDMYWNIFGIGPWHIVTFQPPALHNTIVRGQSVPFTMKLALAQAGDIQWELIQPLTGQSIYQEFLDQKGGGLHHIACDVGDFDQAVAALQQQGIGVLMSGQMPTDSFAYLDTEKVLGTVIEIYNRPANFNPPPPEATYPPAV